MVQQEDNNKRKMNNREFETPSKICNATCNSNLGRANTHYGKIGHVETACYEIIRYPTVWNTRGGRNTHGRGTTDQDDERMNPGRGCGAASGNREVSYVAQVQGEQSGCVAPFKSSHAHTSFHGFPPEQVQWLFSLIDTPKAGLDKLSGKKAWLFDSGASYHLAGEIELLNDVVKIQSIPISPTNGSVTYVVMRGTIELNLKSILHDVLCVPSLDCDMISVAQLLDEICCIVTFTKKLCVV